MRAFTGSSRLLIFAAAATFLSAWLLFLVQPIAVKQVLPTLGGSPLVWNTAMVFFQFFLLMGYMAAHWILHLPTGRMQFMAYAGLLALSLFFLPLHMRDPGGIDPALSPFSWIMASLALSLCLPFMLLSMTNTLVQGWIAQGRSPLSARPYVFYAASNAGSLLALLAFFPLEYLYPLPVLESGWTWLFVLLGAIMCALAVATGVPRMVHEEVRAGAEVADRPSMKQYLRWTGLAFVPSGLFLSVTSHIGINIASVPLLWIVPLAIYLLTFIIAFSGDEWGIRIAIKAEVVFILIVSVILALNRKSLELIQVHLLALFVIALACHGMLARSKPDPRFLSVFYLCVSLGGVLGGIFSSLIAPQVFNSLLEYPMLLVAACLARPDMRQIAGAARRLCYDVLYPLLLLGCAWGCFLILKTFRFAPHGGYADFYPHAFSLGLLIAAAWPLGLLTRRRISLAVLVTAILLSSALIPPDFRGKLLYAHRNFFGVDRVYHAEYKSFQVSFNFFIHGTTLHGIQNLDEQHRLEPAGYYGQVKPIYALLDEDLQKAPVALVGLGTGTSACMGTQAHFDIFEINPDVVKIASDPRLFTYLSGCARDYSILLGDGRVGLSHEPDGRYALIVLDAFSSDAIPTHLLTREAMAMYLKKLRPGGIIALHITSYNFNLAPLVGALAQSLSLEAYRVYRKTSSIFDLSSTWVVLAPSFTDDQRFQIFSVGGQKLSQSKGAVWTDQYSNILPYLK